MTGRELMVQGVKIHIPIRPAAAIIVYRRVGQEPHKTN
jgi:hypothetical protein